jgi:hypothetical protein
MRTTATRRDSREAAKIKSRKKEADCKRPEREGTEKKAIIEAGPERRRGAAKKRRSRVKMKKKNQKNFNSFIHSINIILDMVFLCTLYIFKGTHTRRMDCGVKKVCEGFKHRMVRASSTVPSRLFLFLSAPPLVVPLLPGLLGGGPLR